MCQKGGEGNHKSHDIPLPRQTPPWEDTPLDRLPTWANTPLGRHPLVDTPPLADNPDTTGYGLQAGGMHPTGMHSCSQLYVVHDCISI